MDNQGISFISLLPSPQSSIESELSVDLSSNNPPQNLGSMYGMSQQNQQMPFNQNTSMYGNNPMNVSGSNFAQASKTSS